MSKVRSSPTCRFIWICCSVCLICAALIKPLQDRLELHLRNTAPDPDLLYFNSPAALKKMALGYDSFLAHLYWIRTIQYYGRRDQADKRPVRYKNLAKLLDITTTLNPDLLDAYRSGSYFLAEPDPVGAGRPDEAIRLLDKGIDAHPREWRLLHDKGFIYFWFLKDFKTAGEIWLAAGRLPDAPEWLEGLAAMALSKGGSLQIAISIWQRQLHESNQLNIRENAKNHLLSVQVAKDIWTLEYLVEKYKQKYGAFPRNLTAALEGQSGRHSLVDPLGTPYQYDSSSGSVRLSPDSRVRYLEIPEIYKEELRIRD